MRKDKSTKELLKLRMLAKETIEYAALINPDDTSMNDRLILGVAFQAQAFLERTNYLTILHPEAEKGA